MALSNYFILEELQKLILELKAGKPEEELILEYTNKIDVLANKRIHGALWQLLMKIYDNDAKKLETDISMLTLLQEWGGNRRKALAVLYPAIKKVQKNFVINNNINEARELWLTEPLIYDNDELPFL